MVIIVERGIENINPKPKGIIEIKTINEMRAPKVNSSKKRPLVINKLPLIDSKTPHSLSTKK